VQTHNFAPRVGIAFSPTNMRNTVFRAGFGMNYDALAYSTMASMLPTVPPGFVSTEFTNIFTPIFGFFGNGGLIQTVPTNVFNPSVTPEEARAATSTFIPNQRLPYTMQWNANLQQSIGRFTLEAGYLGVRSFNLPFQNVLNQTARVSATQNLPLFYTTPTQAQLNSLTTNLDQLEAMNNNPLAGAGFTSPIFSYASEGRSWYDGLLVRGSQRFSAGLQMDASYTWSHLIDNLSGPNLVGTSDMGWLDSRTGRHDSIYDHRHTANLATLWDLGAIGGKSFNVVRDILANMVVSGVYTYQSGAPLPLTSGIDAGLAGGFGGTSGVIFNPNGTMNTGSGVTALRNSGGQIVGYQVTNPNAQFIQAGRGVFAPGGTNYIRMNPVNNFDAALSKRFAVRDRFSIELRGDAYNVLNHSQYVPGTLSTLGLGSNSTNWNVLNPGNAAFGDMSQAFSAHPRTLQAGLRILF